MNIEDFKTPKRVWINCPSELQPYHKYHGKVGIGVLREHSTGYREISLFFTEGSLHSMIVDPLYLALKYEL